jgi:hypothetical protein
MSDTDIHIVKCNVLNALQSAEIIALKDRIIQLEEELIDAKGKYAALVADVVLYEDRGEHIKRLEEACGEMVSEEDTYIRLQIWLKAKEAKP